MNRLQQALDDLMRKGYVFSSLEQLKGGINNPVFKAKSIHGPNYVVKLYPLSNEKDVRNRCKTEQAFFKYLQNYKVTNTPILIESDIKAGWNMMSWIEGQKPKNLQSSELQDIADFIGLINDPSSEAERGKLEPASEACETLAGLILSISERIRRLQSSNPKSELSLEAIQWITKTIEPLFKSTSQRLMDTRATCNHWQDLNACKIASPSDMGIHNTLRTLNGLHYLDFEYAGLDDLSKLAADWILQPEYCMDKNQEYIFIHQLQQRMNKNIGSTWMERLKDIKPLIKIKWCLIMLNDVNNDTLSELQQKKTIKYIGRI